MTKFIFVTGGVISGIGKGVAAASIGNILKARGFKIFVLKLDPYLNVDPGVMSPYEHGEVYVTADGGETDLDLGHYERFIDEELSKESNYTFGKIFQNILKKERNGEYNGKTVQFVPHVTDEIKSKIYSVANKYNPDFLIIEVGGSAGDMESNAFFYALREIELERPNHTFFAHVTYIPYLLTSGDFKTKPTQTSVAILSSLGIKPNMVILRSDNEIPEDIIKKVSKTVILNENYVISAPDLSDSYLMPLWLEEKSVAKNILKFFNMKQVKPDFQNWKAFIKKLVAPKKQSLRIALIGKYVEFPDAYKSIIEALKISAIHLSTNLELEYKAVENFDSQKELENKYDGVVLLPGFGERGFDKLVEASLYYRKTNIPTFGICLGMQAMTVAQAHLKGVKNPTSAEFGKEGRDETYILDFIKGKNKDNPLGGTLRLGSSPIIFSKDSKIAQLYENEEVVERHRHRYEVLEYYKKSLVDEEFKFSGENPNNGLVESCELVSHPFYLGVQYHPEFTAKPLSPNKLFTGFLQKAIDLKNN